MKVIIPIAGFGTRLLPFTKVRQKCLLPVAGKPVIDHILSPLIKQGFSQIILITGHLENQVREYVQKFDASFFFVRQQDALGLGHAVYQGLENIDDPVMIQLGDVIYSHNFSKFCDSDYHKIAVDEVPDPQRFGIVEVEENRIVRVLEKPINPSSNLAIVGLYYLYNQRILWEAIRYLIDHNLTTKGEIQLADAFQRMIEMGETITFERVSRWFDCGIPESFLSTNRALLTPSNKIIEGSQIFEPVYIGSGCRIQNSTIGPYVTVMENCFISNSTISDTIIFWNSKIEEATIRHEMVENY